MLFRFSNQGVHVQEFYGETRGNKKQPISVRCGRGNNIKKALNMA
jgi:hypothetical protein